MQARHYQLEAPESWNFHLFEFSCFDDGLLWLTVAEQTSMQSTKIVHVLAYHLPMIIGSFKKLEGLFWPIV